MANTFLTPDIIAKEALMVLENNMVMANLVHRDYSSEFVRVGDTITVRKPPVFQARNFTGTTTDQDINDGSVAVKMDRFRDVSVKISAKEMTLDLNSFSDQVIRPAVSALAQAVDSDLIATGLQGCTAAGTVAATASATDLSDIAKLGKYFDVNAAPIAGRHLVLNPSHKYKYAVTDNLSKVSYAGDNKALRDAEIGRVYGFDTYMSQNAPDTLADTTGTATAAKVTATAGATTVALSGVTAATGTVKAGDGFIVDGYLYRFTEDKTAASGAVESVTIDQPIHAALTAADVILVKSPNSLAFHRAGLALVTRQLELPQGAAKASIASANGLAIRVVFGYDMSTKTDKISFDVIYGTKVLNDKLVAKLVG